MERIHTLKDSKTGVEYEVGAHPIKLTIEQIKFNEWGHEDFHKVFTYDELGITQSNVDASLYSGIVFIQENEGNMRFVKKDANVYIYDSVSVNNDEYTNTDGFPYDAHMDLWDNYDMFGIHIFFDTTRKLVYIRANYDD